MFRDGGTVASLDVATGFEVNGAGGVVGLTNPAAGNFRLAASSICTARGSSAVGIMDDYSGYLFANPPSSGAYQYR